MRSISLPAFLARIAALLGLPTAHSHRAPRWHLAFEELETRATPAGLQVILPAGPLAVNDDLTLRFSAAAGDAVSVTDPSAGSGQDVVYVGVGNGTLGLGSEDGLSAVSGLDTSLVGIVGSVAAINNALNGMVYYPNLMFQGTDLFSVTVDSMASGASATNSTPLTITPGNLAPILDGPAYAEAGAGLLLFSPANGNGITLTDPDSNGGIEDIFVQTVNGSILPLNTGGLISVDGGGSQWVTMAGTVPALNAALNGLIYQAPPGTTSDEIIVSVNDKAHTGFSQRNAELVVQLFVGATYDLAPTATGPGYQAFNNAGATFSQANGNPIHLSDGDNNGAIETVFVQDLYGTLTVNTGGNPLVSGNATSLLALSGSIAMLNAELDTLHYAPGNSTSDYVDVLVTDGGRSASLVNVLFLDSNSILAPTVIVPGGQQAEIDSYLVFSPSGGNALQVASGDAGKSVQTVAVQVIFGRLQVENIAGLATISGNGTSLVQMTGTVAALNAALDGLNYAPSSNGDTDFLDVGFLSTGSSSGPVRYAVAGMQIEVFFPSYC